MPSKSAKQHRFMEAIAHNPAFAKKAGVPQSVGKEFAAADKGKKFVRGGINKQDTRHGKMDMPFNKLNRFAGMKAGGMMKKGRRYEEGGDVERVGEEGETQSFGDAFKEARNAKASTFTWRGKKYTTELAKPAAKADEAPIRVAAPTRAPARAAAPAPAPAPAARMEEARDRYGRTESERAANRAALGEGLSKAASGIGTYLRRTFTPSGRMEADEERRGRRFAKGGMTKGVDKNLPTGKQMGNLNMKAGGMKESKAMVGKEVAFMKKKGAPASMIKHEAAEMGAMKKGGMAKYARGGGIESKGKTKGTIIKMAAGGLAGGHKSADGIAQRGKTKGMKVSMKGGGYC